MVFEVLVIASIFIPWLRWTITLQTKSIISFIIYSYDNCSCSQSNNAFNARVKDSNCKHYDPQLTTYSFRIGAENDTWLIVPDVKAGPITANTSEADLIKIYGKQNVRREEVTDGEGMESEVGSVIYPNNPEKMIKILWKNTKQMKFPKALELSGDKSVWKTTEGLSLGTSVKVLEKVNGGRFSFWGFGFDAGGGIKSWDNGKFEKKYSQLLLMIRLSDKNVSMVEHKVLIGDRVLNSSNELVQKLNPTVSEISINFK